MYLHIDYSSVDDSTALLKQVEAGNQSAARQLVDLYQVKVFNICISLLHNIHDAEDVTQEVFMEVLLHTGDFRGDSNIGTWIYRIAVNRSLNFIRSSKKRRWWKQLDDFLTFSGSEKAEPFVLQQQMEENEQKLILQKAIDALPEKQRSAFTLNKIDDFSYLDVAEIMNLSHSAVESLIHRARLNLQKSLKLYYK